MSNTDTKQLSGWCAVMINPNGVVVTTYADFDRSGYGGFSLDEAQKFRARNIIKRRFVGDHLNGWLASKADEYFCDQFWRVAELAGYKLQLIPVGHEAESE
jgi:hypothetical protein